MTKLKYLRVKKAKGRGWACHFEAPLGPTGWETLCGRASHDLTTCISEVTCAHCRRKLAPGPEVRPWQRKTRDDALQRLATEVVEDPETGCLIWQGSKTAQGYGDLRYERKHQLAHRLAYENAKGPIPEGLYIDHLCRRRDCINPDHMEPVTHAENLRRARKPFCIRGHALTDDNVYVSPGKGLRQCRKCNTMRSSAEAQKRKAARHAA